MIYKNIINLQTCHAYDCFVNLLVPNLQIAFALNYDEFLLFWLQLLYIEPTSISDKMMYYNPDRKYLHSLGCA